MCTVSSQHCRRLTTVSRGRHRSCATQDTQRVVVGASELRIFLAGDMQVTYLTAFPRPAILNNPL